VRGLTTVLGRGWIGQAQPVWGVLPPAQRTRGNYALQPAARRRAQTRSNLQGSSLRLVFLAVGDTTALARTSQSALTRQRSLAQLQYCPRASISILVLMKQDDYFSEKIILLGVSYGARSDLITI
jgi:hypothetical protein